MAAGQEECPLHPRRPLGALHRALCTQGQWTGVPSENTTGWAAHREETLTPAFQLWGNERQDQGGCGAGSYEPGRACQPEVGRPPHLKGVGGVRPFPQRGAGRGAQCDPCKSLQSSCPCLQE